MRWRLTSVVIRGEQASASIAFGTSFRSRDMRVRFQGPFRARRTSGLRLAESGKTGERVIGQKKYKD